MSVDRVSHKMAVLLWAVEAARRRVLATVVRLLIQAPVMLILVRICLRTQVRFRTATTQRFS